MINYKADKVAFPSVRGIPKKKGGAKGVTTDPGAATAVNVTGAAGNFNFDDALLGKYVTIQANGCRLYLAFGRTGDTVTPTATGAVLTLLDGEKAHGILTKDTQRVGHISTGAFTGGLVHWVSERET